MHSATSAFYDDNAPFRSSYLDSRYHDAYRLHRLHCVATARAVGDLLDLVADAGDCRVRYSDASVKQSSSSV